MPVTKPKKIGIGKIRSKEKLAFTVQPDNLNISLWGNDVINQFCWYFNFKTMKVIISVNPINIDTTYSIAIPYTDINRLKYCSIRSKNAVFKNIFIDTGGGAAVFNGNYYVVTLLLTTTTKTGDKITGRGKGMEVDKKPLNASSLEIKYNNYLPFYKDKAGVSIYSGLVGLVDRTSNSIYDDTETNGTIKIGYAKGLYSGLYLDTHKKILYLKP